MKKRVVFSIKKLDGFLSALSCRLVVLTGKSEYPIHPKNLVFQKPWFLNYLRKKDIVLDMGCGPGQLTQQISEKVKTSVGIELDERLLSIANQTALSKKVNNIKFLKADLNKKIPFPDSYFNKIICSDVLEHLNKRDYALKEIKRILKKDGILFLVVDNPDNSWKRLQKSLGIFYYADADHKYEYPIEEIVGKLNKLEFKVLKVAPITFDTPLKGWIDLVGGLSLFWYLRLRKWRENMNRKYPNETVGYRIIAKLGNF